MRNRFVLKVRNLAFENVRWWRIVRFMCRSFICRVHTIFLRNFNKKHSIEKETAIGRVNYVCVQNFVNLFWKSDKLIFFNDKSASHRIRIDTIGCIEHTLPHVLHIAIAKWAKKKRKTKITMTKIVQCKWCSKSAIHWPRFCCAYPCHLR